MNCFLSTQAYNVIKRKVSAAVSNGKDISKYQSSFFNILIKANKPLELSLSSAAFMPRMALELLVEKAGFAEKLMKVYPGKTLQEIKEDLQRESVLYETNLNNLIDALGLDNSYKEKLEAIRTGEDVDIPSQFQTTLQQDIANLLNLEDTNVFKVELEKSNKILQGRLDTSLKGNQELYNVLYDTISTGGDEASNNKNNDFLVASIDKALSPYKGLVGDIKAMPIKEKLDTLARLNSIGIANNNIFSSLTKTIRKFKVEQDDKLVMMPVSRFARDNFKSKSLAIEAFLEQSGGYNIFRTTIQSLIKAMYLASNDINFDETGRIIIENDPQSVFERVLKSKTILNDEEQALYENYINNGLYPTDEVKKQKILTYHIISRGMLPSFFEAYASFGTVIEFDNDLEASLEIQDEADTSERYIEAVSYDKNKVYKANALVKAHFNNISLLTLRKQSNGRRILTYEDGRETVNAGVMTEILYPIKEAAIIRMRENKDFSFQEAFKKGLIDEINKLANQRINSYKLNHLVSYYYHFFGDSYTSPRGDTIKLMDSKDFDIDPSLFSFEKRKQEVVAMMQKADEIGIANVLDQMAEDVSSTKGLSRYLGEVGKSLGWRREAVYIALKELQEKQGVDYLDSFIEEVNNEVFSTNKYVAILSDNDLLQESLGDVDTFLKTVDGAKNYIPKSVYANYLANVSQANAVINSYLLSLKKENILLVDMKEQDARSRVKSYTSKTKKRDEERFSFAQKVQNNVMRPIADIKKNIDDIDADKETVFSVYLPEKVAKAQELLNKYGASRELKTRSTEKGIISRFFSYKFPEGSDFKKTTTISRVKQADGSFKLEASERKAINVPAMTKEQMTEVLTLLGINDDFDLDMFFPDGEPQTEEQRNSVYDISKSLWRSLFVLSEDGRLLLEGFENIQSFDESIEEQYRDVLGLRAVALDYPDELLIHTSSYLKVDSSTLRTRGEKIIVVNTLANDIINSVGLYGSRYRGENMSRILADIFSDIEYNLLADIADVYGNSKTYEELNMEERISLFMELSKSGYFFGITPSNKNSNYIIRSSKFSGNEDFEAKLHLLLAEDVLEAIGTSYNKIVQDVTPESIASVQEGFKKLTKERLEMEGFVEGIHFDMEGNTPTIAKKSLAIIQRTKEELDKIVEEDYNDFIKLVNNETRPSVQREISAKLTKGTIQKARQAYILDALIKFGHPNVIQDNIQLSKRIIQAQTKHTIGDSSIPQGIERNLKIAVAKDRKYSDEYAEKTQSEILLDIAKELNMSKVAGEALRDAFLGDALSFQTMLGQMQTIASFGKKIVKGTEAGVDAKTHLPSFGKTSIVGLTNEFTQVYSNNEAKTIEKNMLGDVLYAELEKIRKAKLDTIRANNPKHSKLYIKWLKGHNDYKQLYNLYVGLRENFENIEVLKSNNIPLSIEKKRALFQKAISGIPFNSFEKKDFDNLMAIKEVKQYFEMYKQHTFLLENATAQKTRTNAVENPLIESSTLSGYYVPADTYGEVTDIVSKPKRGFIAQPSQANYIASQSYNATKQDTKDLFENNANIVRKGKEAIRRELNANEKGEIEEKDLKKAEQVLMEIASSDLVAEGDDSVRTSIAQDPDVSINNPMIERLAFESMSRNVKRNTANRKVLGIRNAIISGTGIVKLVRLSNGEAITISEAVRRGIITEDPKNISTTPLRNHKSQRTGYALTEGNIATLDNLRPARFVKEKDGVQTEILERETLESLLTLKGEELTNFMNDNNIKRLPTEVLLPNVYKDLIGDGNVDEILSQGKDYFLKRIAEAVVEKNLQKLSPNKRERINKSDRIAAARADEKNIAAAEESYNAFIDFISNVIGTRIPTTGYNSIQDMKIVGFYESSDNSIITPVEILFFSGADNDGDMIANEFIELERGEIPGSFRVKEDSPSTINVRKKKELYGSPENTARSIAPIDFEQYKTLAKEKEQPVMKKFSAAAMLISQKVNLGSQKLTGIAVKFSEVYHLYRYIIENNPEVLGENVMVNTIDIDGVQYRSVGVGKEVDGFEIPKLIEEYANLLLDDTKYNASELLNINTETLPVVNYLLMTYEMPIKHILNFINTPEIKALSKALMVETRTNILSESLILKNRQTIKSEFINNYDEESAKNIELFFDFKANSELIIELGRKILSLTSTPTIMDEYIKNIENFFNCIDTNFVEVMTSATVYGTDAISFLDNKIKAKFNNATGLEKLPYALYLNIPYIKESINAIIYDLQLKKNFFPAMQDKTLLQGEGIFIDISGKMAQSIKKNKGFGKYFDFIQRVKALDYLADRKTLSVMTGEELIKVDSAFNGLLQEMTKLDMSIPEQRLELYGLVNNLAEQLIVKSKDEDGYKIGKYIKRSSSKNGEPIIEIKGLRGYTMNNHLALREAFDELSRSNEGRFIAQALLVSALMRKNTLTFSYNGMWAMFDKNALSDYNEYLINNKTIQDAEDLDFRFFWEHPNLAPQESTDFFGNQYIRDRRSKSTVFLEWSWVNKNYTLKKDHLHEGVKVFSGQINRSNTKP
jgi:hypothetical protein